MCSKRPIFVPSSVSRPLGFEPCIALVVATFLQRRLRVECRLHRKCHGIRSSSCGMGGSSSTSYPRLHAKSLRRKQRPVPSLPQSDRVTVNVLRPRTRPSLLGSWDGGAGVGAAASYHSQLTTVYTPAPAAASQRARATFPHKGSRRCAPRPTNVTCIYFRSPRSHLSDAYVPVCRAPLPITRTSSSRQRAHHLRYMYFRQRFETF